MIDIQRETLDDVIDECQGLIQEHWEEIALDKGSVSLDPDWEAYYQIESSGNLCIITARDNGVLVGYSVYFVVNNIHYKSLIVAETDIFWLAPSHRLGMAGLRLMKQSEAILKAMGVKKIVSKVKDHNDVGAVFERLGYTAIERVYWKGIN